jgi:hypothetical protein
MLWVGPALATGEGGLVRLHATEFLPLCGAMVLIVIERHAEEGLHSDPGAVTEL